LFLLFEEELLERDEGELEEEEKEDAEDVEDVGEDSPPFVCVAFDELVLAEEAAATADIEFR
jgi:hypothetical protein